MAALKPRWDSRVVDVTFEGCTIQDVYTGKWDDLTTAGAYSGPLLGDHHGLAPHGYQCWCTNIHIDPIDNTNCKITYLFSSNGFGEPRKQEGAGAWEEYIDTQSTEYTSDVVLANINQMTSWKELWTDAHTESDPHTAENKPTLTLHTKHTIFRIVCYAPFSFYSTLAKYIGKINSDTFMDKYSAYKVAATGQDVAWSLGDDTDRWLFSGCSVDPVANNRYRYNMSFIYNQTEDWNKPHGISIEHYENFNCGSLFSAINAVATQPDEYDPGRGT